eukprot:c8671_g1_i2.p1 GENE.c8671_g1_i2~~c8671_g1_i2.p1  ORF type:complete len:400 (-),score=61.54 c8671_g1_i2:140-1339(-)
MVAFSKFGCFLPTLTFKDEDAGYFDLKSLSVPTNPNAQFAIYNDESYSWPATYSHGKHKSCSEITKTRGEGGPALARFNATELQNQTRQWISNPDGPRFWYLAAFDCNEGIESVRFRVHFRQNSKPFYREFSYERKGFLTQYIAFFILFACLGALHLWVLMPLYNSRTVHPLINLLTASLGMQALSVSFYLVHFSVYASNGIGSPGTKVLAGVLDVCSQIVFVALLLLVAKGWAITQQSNLSKPLFLLVLTIFVFQYFSLFVWDVAKRDQSDNTFVYQTIPGIVILCVRMVIMLWACWSLLTTYRAETLTEKKSFYKQFATVLVAWFLSSAFIAVVASAANHLERELIASAFYLCFNWVFMGMMMILLWPTRLGGIFQTSDASNPSLVDTTTINPYEDL